MKKMRTIDNFPDYAVTSDGRVFRITPVRRKTPVPYELKKTPDNGYLTVNLMNKAGRPRKVGVHRLVCAAFNGPPGPGQIHVAHNDGDGCNNNAGNLRWATPKENCSDKVEHQTLLSGEKVSGAKLTRSAVEEIRAGYGMYPLRTFAEKFNVTIAAVHSAAVGKTWK